MFKLTDETVDISHFISNSFLPQKDKINSLYNEMYQYLPQVHLAYKRNKTEDIQETVNKIIKIYF